MIQMPQAALGIENGKHLGSRAGLCSCWVRASYSTARVKGPHLPQSMLFATNRTSQRETSSLQPKLTNRGQRNPRSVQILLRLVVSSASKEGGRSAAAFQELTRRLPSCDVVLWLPTRQRSHLATNFNKCQNELNCAEPLLGFCVNQQLAPPESKGLDWSTKSVTMPTSGRFNCFDSLPCIEDWTLTARFSVHASTTGPGSSHGALCRG